MEKLIKVLKEEGIKFKPIPTTRQGICTGCALKDGCQKDLKAGHKIIFLPKQENCMIV